MNAEAIARLLWLLLILAGPSGADVFQSGDLRLQAGELADSYELTAQLPAAVARDSGLEWPAGCRQTRVRLQALGERSLLSIAARCERALQHDDVIRTPWQLSAARLHSTLAATPSVLTLRPSGSGIVIPMGIGAGDRGWSSLAPEMLWQGLRHIGVGWDHLAFLLCLCMLFRGMQLLGLITAFTVGHSISLGLAFFDLLRLPLPPVEALIALSIVLLAREGLLARAAGQSAPALPRALVLVVVFGLVHGLGFASALAELGIAAGERWPALVYFNLGVEIGQIAFVALVLATLALLRMPAMAAGARRASLYAAGVAGSYWLIDRIAAFPQP